MTCVVCNLVNEKSFEGKENPFYCETAKKKREFWNEFINDVIINHRELLDEIHKQLIMMIKWAKQNGNKSKIDK